jgi:hypothetical protein
MSNQTNSLISRMREGVDILDDIIRQLDSEGAEGHRSWRDDAEEVRWLTGYLADASAQVLQGLSAAQRAVAQFVSDSCTPPGAQLSLFGKPES